MTKDVPAYAIVGGNPIKVIRYRYDDETVELLEKLSWWNRNITWITEHLSQLTTEKVDIELLKSLIE